MHGYLLTPAAEEDLKQIWRYTASNWSIEHADIYLNELFDGFESLAAHPLSGQQVDWIRVGYRRKVINAHTVFYRLTVGDLPEIIRVLHGRVDIESNIE